MKDEKKEKIKAYYVANDIDEILDYITNLQQENNKQKEVLDKIKEKVSYYRLAKYGTYDSDDILSDLSYILLEEIE